MDDHSRRLSSMATAAELFKRVQPVLIRLRANGFHAYITGGCIRDLLCGMRVQDLDMVTDAMPIQLFQLFDRVSIIGHRHQLAVVRDGGISLEVSTLASVAMDGSNTLIGRLAADASTRDFRVNALYWDPLAGKVHDPCGGLADLDAFRLSCVGDACASLAFDPIRMLRAARLAAKLGFDIDPHLLASMRQTELRWDAESCWRAARELIRMGQFRPSSAWRWLDQAGQLGAFLPPEHHAFLRAALGGRDGPHTPAYLIAVLLWPSLGAKMANVDRSSSWACHAAVDELIDAQSGLLRHLLNKHDGGCRNLLLMQLHGDALRDGDEGVLGADARCLAAARNEGATS